MTQCRLVRDYENPDLPLNKRLPSLARRFECLKNAQGLEPWSPDKLHDWVKKEGRGTDTWHAAHLILNLSGNGNWETFDAVGAIDKMLPKDRKTFAAWAISWRI